MAMLEIPGTALLSLNAREPGVGETQLNRCRPGEEFFCPLLRSRHVPSKEGDELELDTRAIALGVLAQWLHVVGLYVATPLEDAQVGSLFLVLATGLVGGVVAGDRAGPPTTRSARHGLLAGLFGGTGTAAFFWWLLATPGAPRGAFWSLGTLVATSQLPGIRTHGEVVVGLLAVCLATSIAVLAWIAGRRAPNRAESVLERA